MSKRTATEAKLEEPTTRLTYDELMDRYNVCDVTLSKLQRSYEDCQKERKACEENLVKYKNNERSLLSALKEYKEIKHNYATLLNNKDRENKESKKQLAEVKEELTKLKEELTRLKPAQPSGRESPFIYTPVSPTYPPTEMYTPPLSPTSNIPSTVTSTSTSTYIPVSPSSSLVSPSAAPRTFPASYDYVGSYYDEDDFDYNDEDDFDYGSI